MKNRLLIAFILFVPLGLFAYFWWHPGAEKQPAGVEDQIAQDAVAPPGPPQPLEYTNLPPDIVLENVQHAIGNFGAQFGGIPVGSNPEITRALAGDNPKQVNFINADAGLRVNDQGELVDPWGTPFLFRQLSTHETEIHSAGPDRRLWTADDLILK